MVAAGLPGGNRTPGRGSIYHGAVPEDRSAPARERADVSPGSVEDPQSAFERQPLTRPEYLNVLVHFYRAEVGRSTVWRQRLDATTNWAVLTAAGMLSFTFSSPQRTHLTLLLSNFLVLAFLVIEARRYRYFEVYRARVRMLEENFLLPVITRRLESPKGSRWRDQVAEDLDRPKYKCTFPEAMGFRLRRNYIFLFAILLAAWLIKLAIHPVEARSWREIVERMRVGGLTPAVILGLGVAFYAALAVVYREGRKIHGEAPADEIAGLEDSLERWKL